MQPASAQNNWECLQSVRISISGQCMSKPTARRVIVCDAVIWAWGGYFEESNIKV